MNGNLQWRLYPTDFNSFALTKLCTSVMMFFRWLSPSLSLFYVMFENLVVARSVQYMLNPCVQRHNLKGQLQPHVFLVHLVPNGIAIKPLLKCCSTWSCLKSITVFLSESLQSEQHGFCNTHDPRVKRVKLVFMLLERNH